MSHCTADACTCSVFTPNRLLPSKCGVCSHRLSQHPSSKALCSHPCSSVSCPFCRHSQSSLSQHKQIPFKVAPGKGRQSPTPARGNKGGKVGGKRREEGKIESVGGLEKRRHAIQGNSSFDMQISVSHAKPVDIQLSQVTVFGSQATKSTECESSSNRTFKPKTLDSRPASDYSDRKTWSRYSLYSGQQTKDSVQSERSKSPLTRKTLEEPRMTVESAAYHSHLEQIMIEQILTKRPKKTIKKRDKSPYSQSISQSRSHTPVPRSKSPTRVPSSLAVRVSSRKSSIHQSPSVSQFDPEEDVQMHKQRVAFEYYPGISLDSAPTSYQATARVMEFEDERLMLYFSGAGHKNAVNDVCLQDGFLVTASADYTVGKWKIPRVNADPYKMDTGMVRIGSVCEPLIRRRAHAGKVLSIERVDSSRYCTGGADNLVRFWSSQEDEDSASEVLRGEVGPMQFLALLSYPTLVSAGSSKSIQILDLSTRKTTMVFPSEHKLPITALRPSAVFTFFTGSEDSLVKLWDVRVRRSVASLTGHSGSVNCLSLFDESKLITGSTDCTVRTWDLRTQSEVQRLEDDEAIFTVCCAKGLIFSGGYHFTVWEDGQQRRIRFHSGVLRSIRFFPEVNLLTTAGTDGKLGVWKILC